MDHVSDPAQPRYLHRWKRQEEGPLGPPSEFVSGGFLVGALVVSIDLWLLGVLAVRWLTS